jgi:hypothetical protein
MKTQSLFPSNVFALNRLPRGYTKQVLPDSALCSIVTGYQSFYRHRLERPGYQVTRRQLPAVGEEVESSHRIFCHDSLLAARWQALTFVQEMEETAATGKALPVMDEVEIHLIGMKGGRDRRIYATIYQKALPVQAPDTLTILPDKRLNEEDEVTLEKLLRHLGELEAEERYYIQKGQDTGLSFYLEISANEPYAAYILASAYDRASDLIRRYNHANRKASSTRLLAPKPIPYAERIAGLAA